LALWRSDDLLPATACNWPSTWRPTT